ALEHRADSVTTRLKLASGATQQLNVERVILAIGITGNVEGRGLEEQGVATDKGHIVIDEWCRTSAEGVYAIGDVAGPPWLAHKASPAGSVCVERFPGAPSVTA